MEIHVGGFQEMHVTLNQAWVHVDGTYSKLQNVEVMALHLEIQLGIDKWWEIGSEHYNHFHQEASLLNYHTALDALEQLVAMCLFELSEFSLSGTADLERYCGIQLPCKPAHCEAMIKYFKIQCTREEIQQLNVEIYTPAVIHTSNHQAELEQMTAALNILASEPSGGDILEHK
ncbi:hypothetical protein DFH29DRAFT_870903 [Suillus ampliporus]|nr:hypothetical protein DFH29DRAFT_870903 [Suillus ampliporus]